MGDAAYRGISASHGDSRFAGKEARQIAALAAQGKFPPSFAQRVDVRRVALDVVRPWIADKTRALLGFEDDVVCEYAMGMLEGDENRVSGGASRRPGPGSAERLQGCLSAGE
jgi:serine/arginine repetitive matrix protein 1